eukprot:SAG31_NODE_126_length_23665_cov_6.178987_16_plen_193_part_00
MSHLAEHGIGTWASAAMWMLVPAASRRFAPTPARRRAGCHANCNCLVDSGRHVTTAAWTNNATRDANRHKRRGAGIYGRTSEALTFSTIYSVCTYYRICYIVGCEPWKCRLFPPTKLHTSVLACALSSVDVVRFGPYHHRSTNCDGRNSCKLLEKSENSQSLGIAKAHGKYVQLVAQRERNKNHRRYDTVVL